MAERLDEVGDEELVKRLRAGDRGAARALFTRHEALLRARARRRVDGLRRKLGASDVVQETYLAAFEGLDGFEDRGPGSFRRWLETILAHRAADQVRRHLRAGRNAKREVSEVPGASRSGPAASGPSPSTVAIGAEERAALHGAVASMTGDDRTVLTLVAVEGRDFAQAARMMGRSPEAVRKLYGRAVLHLGRAIRRSR